MEDIVYLFEIVIVFLVRVFYCFLIDRKFWLNKMVFLCLVCLNVVFIVFIVLMYRVGK